NGVVRQFAAALALIDRERADAAVDVDPAVSLCGAGIVAQLVERFLLRGERLRERLQHQRALMEGERAQRWPTLLAREPRHGAEVEPLRRSERNEFAVHC